MRISVISNIRQTFPLINFESFEAEHNPNLCADINYLGYVTKESAFGLQIKPITAQSNYGDYSVAERMKASFDGFKNDFGGNLFIVHSIANKQVIKRL